MFTQSLSISVAVWRSNSKVIFKTNLLGNEAAKLCYIFKKESKSLIYFNIGFAEIRKANTCHEHSHEGETKEGMQMVSICMTWLSKLQEIIP